MKTPIQKMINWVTENAFNVTAEDGTTYIAIDAEEMRLNYDMWLDEEKEQIIDAYADGIDHDYDIEFGIQDSDRQNYGEEYYNENYNQTHER